MFKIIKFKTLPSTQDKVKQFAKKGFKDIVVVSESQTNSRGRFKRKWISSKGGLWISILLKPKSIGKLQFLTFIAAISVLETIKRFAKLNAKIKWPNDVHYKGKKLCGILTESVLGKENYAIVGIGLNVNQGSFPGEIKGIATSLRIEIKKRFDIEEIQNYLLERVFYYNGECYSKSKFDEILFLLRKNCDTVGRKVTVIGLNRKITGFVFGIDDEGKLLIRLKNGKTEKIIEGDVRIRH